MDQVTSVGDLPSLGIPILLTLACNLFAAGLKRAAGSVVDRWIPVILMVFGGIMYPMVASASDLKVNASNPTIYMVLVGVCIGGLAVGLNQVLKQFTKEDKEPNEPK